MINLKILFIKDNYSKIYTLNISEAYIKVRASDITKGAQKATSYAPQLY